MKILIMILGLGAMLFLTGCPKDNPIKPDPCADKSPVRANFMIYPILNTQYPDGWIKLDSDTILHSDAEFVGPINADYEYEWHIGSEIIYTKDIIRRNFPRGQFIPITLIVRGIPDTICFPNNDGVDTVTRYIYFLPLDSTGKIEVIFPIYGKFLGYNIDEPSATFIITITEEYIDTIGVPWITTNRIQNLTPGSDISQWEDFYGDYKEVYFKDDEHFNYLTPKGIAIINGKNNDSIEINYSIQKDTGWDNRSNRIDKKFIGRRVQ